MGRPGYPAEFRRKVLDLLAEGRSVAGIGHDLDVSEQTIYNWRRQDRIDRGVQPGLTTPEKGELSAANTRIAELETELADWADIGVRHTLAGSRPSRRRDDGHHSGTATRSERRRGEYPLGGPRLLRQCVCRGQQHRRQTRRWQHHRSRHPGTGSTPHRREVHLDFGWLHHLRCHWNRREDVRVGVRRDWATRRRNHRHRTRCSPIS